MATRQRHGSTTGQGRRRQQRQQPRQHQRAEHHAQPANGQEDEATQRGIHDEVPVGLVTGPFVAPIVAQPLFYIPPSNAPVYHPVVLQYEPYVPFVEDRGVVAGPEYVRLLEASMLWNLYGEQGRGEGPQRGTGEPHEGAHDNAPQHMVGAEEGHGDVQQNPVSAEDPWEGLENEHYGPVVTSYGTVSIMLRHCVRVDISVHGAVRVVNFPKHCTAAINSGGECSCICHPCGRVLQQGGIVHMATGTRLAQISIRGVTFTAFNHGLVYLVDASGTKSTTERFQILSYDIPLNVFAYEVPQGAECFDECFRIVREAKQKTSRNGEEIWIVNGVRIKQTPWGDVQVSRDSGRRVIWTSPTAGTISVNTPIVKSAMSCDPRKFFFVKVGQKRLNASADAFTVRNGSQRAGFDSRGRLILP
ncbi:uncharacterized protein LOC119375581 [Rhipicephalus sanguineus]|uniref:Uncharacterized protein n=1 Tax=Rhipicephalus sanguineus TaxID=34632 RepID=A0A9D4QGY4_RHISA|nr:uncharacterized protein LOC119375581 [Rhipicephalus sanguineus]KAH7982613.1 hypothetical protein HPB52_006119 [Rhipicephalus sanguineus]